MALESAERVCQLASVYQLVALVLVCRSEAAVLACQSVGQALELAEGACRLAWVYQLVALALACQSEAAALACQSVAAASVWGRRLLAPD